jgi:hypothetical protein
MYLSMGPSLFGVLGCCNASVPANEEGLHCHVSVLPGRPDVRAGAQSRDRPTAVQEKTTPCRAKLT